MFEGCCSPSWRSELCRQWSGMRCFATSSASRAGSAPWRRHESHGRPGRSFMVRVRDLNWMQLEEYLERDNRVVLPLGSTEQHAYLSLETDNILAERVSVEAAEPLGVPVLPVLPYGLTAMFAAAYPGSPTLKLETYAALLRELLDSLYRQGFRRFLLVNGHGAHTPAR